MVNARIKAAIGRMDRALERIERHEREGGLSAAASPGNSGNQGLSALLDEARAGLEARDRTISKLRADLQDITRLKDEEIARLRSELEARPDSVPQMLDCDEPRDVELARKYERLRETAEATLAELDAMIDAAERRQAGHG